MRTVVTPGLPPLGAGAIDMSYRSPPAALAPAAADGAESNPPAAAELTTDGPNRLPLVRRNSAEGAAIIAEAQVRLAELADVELAVDVEGGSPAQASADKGEAYRRMKSARREARSMRRSASGGAGVEQYL